MKTFFRSKLMWVGVVLFVVGMWWFLGREELTPQYEMISVERTTITETVDVSGNVEPVSYADGSFLLSGEVERVFVSVGDVVSARSVLAQLDGASYQSALAQAQAAARIAEADERLARRVWDDLKPEQREAKKLASEQARQAAAIAAANVEKTYLRAPMAGTITKWDVREGEFVAAGNPIVRISGEDGLRVSVDIPESDIADLSVGQEGEASFDAFGPREKYRVRLAEIEPDATVVQGVVYYTAYFDILDEEPRLRSGMSADIEVRIAESHDTLFLPFRAVYETRDRVFVEILDQNGLIVEHPIEIGLEDDEGNVEILSGLSEGDAVVVRAKKTL
jgi:RND family efflux transporter MFP subunit